MKYILILVFCICITCYTLYVSHIDAVEMSSPQYKMKIEIAPEVSTSAIFEKFSQEAALFKKNGFFVFSDSKPVVFSLSDSTIELQENTGILRGSSNLDVNENASSIYIDFVEKNENNNSLRLQINKKTSSIPSYIQNNKSVLEFSSAIDKNKSVAEFLGILTISSKF